MFYYIFMCVHCCSVNIVEEFFFFKFERVYSTIEIPLSPNQDTMMRGIP